MLSSDPNHEPRTSLTATGQARLHPPGWNALGVIGIAAGLALVLSDDFLGRKIRKGIVCKDDCSDSKSHSLRPHDTRVETTDVLAINP